jgi:hypothetical protein
MLIEYDKNQLELQLMKNKRNEWGNHIKISYTLKSIN